MSVSAGARFDPFEVATALDPYPTYRELRGVAPVYHNEARDFWALSRFEDVRGASRDWGTFSNAEGLDLDELDRRVFGPGDFLDMDPPDHDELRAVVNGQFTPKAIAALEPLIREQVRVLLRDLPVGETVDAVARLARPLPIGGRHPAEFPRRRRRTARVLRRLRARAPRASPG